MQSLCTVLVCGTSNQIKKKNSSWRFIDHVNVFLALHRSCNCFLGNALEEKHSVEGDWRDIATTKLSKLKKLDGMLLIILPSRNIFNSNTKRKLFEELSLKTSTSQKYIWIVLIMTFYRLLNFYLPNSFWHLAHNHIFGQFLNMSMCITNKTYVLPI